MKIKPLFSINLKSSIMKDKIYYILFLILACVSANAETQQHVKLAAVKLYEFPLCGVADSVTSRYDAKHHLMFLSGFDTDGHGTFWFVGGNPMYVTCYKGSKMLFRRQLSDTFSNFSATRLRGDSLYTVHTNRHSLLAVHKSGKGPIREIFLPYDFADGGTAHEDEILLARGVAGRSPWANSDDEVGPNCNTLVKVFDYSGKLKREYVTKKDKLDALYPVPQIKGEELSFFEYVGKWRGLYVIHEEFAYNHRLRLFDTDSRMRGRYIMPKDSTFLMENVKKNQYPPNPVFTCEEDCNSFYHTPDFDIIRNGHFFRVWYYCGEGRNCIVVEDVDLAVAFPNIKGEGL